LARFVTPIFKLEYWELLSDVLLDKASVNARPLKTWLTPLLHRIPLQTILSAFLANYRENEPSNELTDTVSSCLNILWPISVQKMSLEGLADLLCLLLQNIDNRHPVSGIVNIALLITSSYRVSLGNAVNKKKVIFISFFYYIYKRVFSHVQSSFINFFFNLP
jgi:hypothetical protein